MLSSNSNALRSLALRGLASSAAPRQFSTTARALVKVGDKIPSIELKETSPGNKVNLAEAMKGKGVIVGVPAAFSAFLSHLGHQSFGV
jgi:2-Cys peroxiredoxin 5